MTSGNRNAINLAASPLSFLAPVAASSALRNQSSVGTITSIVEGVLLWHERSRQRRALMALSDHMLRDIGCSRAEAHGEAAKSFWRA